MKTQYYAASSLDGFIATENDSLDWLFPLGDLDNSSYPEFISNVGALAIGASTYEWICGDMILNSNNNILRASHRCSLRICYFV